MTEEIEARTANIGLAIWRLKCFYETFVKDSTFAILLNICAKNPPHRQAENRCRQLNKPVQMLKLFIFVCLTLSFLLFACSHNTKDLNCKDFKNGSFFYKGTKSRTTYAIFRNDTTQLEHDPTTNNKVWTKIKWISDCEYELTYIGEIITNNDTILGQLKQSPLRNKIIRTVAGEAGGTNYNFCIIESSMNGIKQKLIDTLYKSSDTD